MADDSKDALRLDFDRRLKLEFHGTKVTCDAGLLAYRELHVALCLTSAIDSELRGIRIKGNQILYARIEHLLTRPLGHPPKNFQKPHSQRIGVSWGLSGRCMGLVGDQAY